MDREYEALVRRGTWKLVPLSKVPKGKRIIPSVWSFKKKYYNGTFMNDKSRGCAGGHRQVKGHDFLESYSPTTKMSSVRMTLALAAEEGWETRHNDIDNAFLYGNIEEGYEIYMYPFEGYEQYNTDPEIGTVGELMIPFLIKGLYGLVQAALLFNKELIAFFKEAGFYQCIKDPCIFTKQT